jgi:FkbM family methyltransferase
MKKIISHFIRKRIEDLGYMIQKREFMAFGIDHAMDIIRFRKGGKPIKTILDVGANIGQSALYYAALFPKANIFSFEPISATFHELQANVSQQKRIKCFQLALGLQSDSIEVQLQSCSLWNSLLNSGQHSTGNQETVQVVSLDEFLDQNMINHIDLLKIDAEGFDLEVLKGGKNFLSSTNDVYIYIETTFLREDSNHTNFEKIHEFVYDYGFRFVGIYDHDYNSFAPPLPPLSYCNALFYKA